MARDLRNPVEVGPPRELLVFVESEWAGPPNLLLEDRDMFRGRPRIRWCTARRRWIRRYVTSREQFDRFFAPDVVFPPGENVQDDYDIAAVLTGHPRWRSDWSNLRP